MSFVKTFRKALQQEELLAREELDYIIEKDFTCNMSFVNTFRKALQLEELLAREELEYIIEDQIFRGHIISTKIFHVPKK